MAEVRCPMCSKPNSEDAEVCEFCGARIKPLIVGQDSEDVRDETRDEIHDEVSSSDAVEEVAPSAESSDWLSKMRDEAGADEEDIETTTPLESERGSTDLLGRLEGLGLSDTSDDSSSQDRSADEAFREQLGDIEATKASDVFEEPFEDQIDEPTQALDDGAQLPDISGAEDDIIAEPGEESDRARVPDWLAKIRDRREKESEQIDEVSATEPFAEEQIIGSGPIAEDLGDDEQQEHDPAFIETDEGITKGGLSWNFIEEDDLEPLVDGFEIPEDSSIADLIDELDSPIEAEDQALEDSKIFADPKVDPFEPGTAEDLLAELESSSELEELVSASEETVDDDQVFPERLTSLEALFDEFGSAQDAEDIFGKLDESPADDEDSNVSPALENLIAELDRHSDPEIEQESPLIDQEELVIGSEDTPSEQADAFIEQEVPPTEHVDALFEEEDSPIVEDEASLERLYEAFGPGSDADEVSSETMQPADELAASANLEDLFMEEQVTEDDVAFDQDMGLEEVIGEDGEDDLFADINRSLDTGELISAAHDLPPELQGDIGDEAAFEAMIADEVELEVEPEATPLPDDLVQSLEAGEEVQAESLIDSDFLADLGLDVEEPEKSLDAGLTEPMLEQPIIEDIPVEHDGGVDALQGEGELAELSDPLADEGDQGDDFTSSPPFRFADIDPSQMDDELGGLSPSWLDTARDEGDEAIEEGAEPVPALILEEGETTDDEFGQQLLAAEVEMDEMPSWLQDLGADIDENEFNDDEQEQPEIARAKLPPWLEAMRPIETFQTSPELELEEQEVEEITEAAGPLAGLRGVLLAEPVVAMPRSASTGVAALDISELHYEHTEILRQMVSEEELELARPETAVSPYPIVRWICGALLVLAVALPTILGFPTFEEPRFAPRSLNSFLEIVNTTPPEKPALLIFDYEPGFSGEMDAAAGALVDNLFTRNQAIATLSTRPSGPLLADRMLLRTRSELDIENGKDYFHLGYLSGGPSAIQLFANSPRSSLVSGFRVPEDFENEQPWSAELLSSVNQISDFSLIAVLTSGTENARIWVEQLHPQLGDTPLVFVTTAGAEPLMRPYFESETPQIDGLLTGLQSAHKYEIWNGELSDAFQRWNSFGMGILVAELILIAGLIYGSAKWLINQGILDRE